MKEALLLLRLEHRNFDELLNLIDEQRHNLKQGTNVNVKLLQSAAEYFSGYPDECHHPVEDIVLQRLRIRDAESAPDLNILSKEHREIERLTALLATTVNSRDDQTSDLEEVIKQFVTYYRKHMSTEEEHFFPAAAKALSKADWEEIEFDLFDREDPLFDGAAHRRYRKLREEIENSARESDKRTFRLKQVKRIQRLGSISEFNDWIREAGADWLLVRHPEGGYGLELDGRAIMDIPECSEVRAIWCAYYFLQGRENQDMRP